LARCISGVITTVAIGRAPYKVKTADPSRWSG
jgi:hypothetical protein